MSFQKFFKNQRGFTLIELLIVISLLGALAVGLLATVDPFEQLKKGGDTSLRNTTSEVYNSGIRYYAIKSNFPWTSDLTGGQALSDLSMTADITGYLKQIISAGELKPEFVELAGGNLSKIFLTSTADVNGARQNISVCFLPESKSFLNEKNAKFNRDGISVSAGCLSQTAGGSACYWCIK